MTLTLNLGSRSSGNISHICTLSFAKKREICKQAGALIPCASLGIAPDNVMEILHVFRVD